MIGGIAHVLDLNLIEIVGGHESIRIESPKQEDIPLIEDLSFGGQGQLVPLDPQPCYNALVNGGALGQGVELWGQRLVLQHA